ncbi:MAG: class I SAM-dependent methyltransferase [Euryarchaeota archaeon]|nr:class I SAM-dependent methyltransferase [Euryarchaeota archaeon]
MSDVRENFDRVYQTHVPIPYNPLYLRCMEEGGRSLDVGCGMGDLPILLRQRGREAYGVDFSQGGISRGQADARRLGMDPGFLGVADVDGGIPFPDGFFDVVGSHWVVEHVDDPRVMLREMMRVTRPGGRVLLFTSNGLTPFVNADDYTPSARNFLRFWSPYLRFRLGLPVDTGVRRMVDKGEAEDVLNTYAPMPFVLRRVFVEAGLRRVVLRTWNMHGSRRWPRVGQRLAYLFFDVLDRAPVAKYMGHGLFLMGVKG